LRRRILSRNNISKRGETGDYRGAQNYGFQDLLLPMFTLLFYAVPSGISEAVDLALARTSDTLIGTA
jgi:hypothetical protein